MGVRTEQKTKCTKKSGRGGIVHRAHKETAKEELGGGSFGSVDGFSDEKKACLRSRASASAWTDRRNGMLSFNFVSGWPESTVLLPRASCHAGYIRRLVRPTINSVTNEEGLNGMAGTGNLSNVSLLASNNSILTAADSGLEAVCSVPLYWT